jgi:hypothetical protein
MQKGRLIAFMSLAALAACGQRASADEEASRANAATAAETAVPAAAPSGPDPDLPRELELTAQMLSKQLPLRHRTEQGMVTVSGVEARGTEMIHIVDVPTDLNAGTFEQFKAQLPARLCEDGQLRQLLLRGGTQTYVMRDKDGEEFRATVDRC